ncbi:unnamed protein product [Hydatigera taeniaeformis]|uniref:tRNA-binding domain-containing protein n=1 Tax=Hydatigena taeniaeformis TaxID=6205 RepID=A0A3P7EZ64_HYDTA|nr:unnamed protein product [Hydatigera taeniaeformis]
MNPSTCSGVGCQLDNLFSAELWHPGDLKFALEEALVRILQSPLVECLSVLELSRLIDDAFPLPRKKAVKSTPVKAKTTSGPEEGSFLVRFLDERRKDTEKSKVCPGSLEMRIGEVVDVKSHPTSADFNVCRVSFGAGENDRISVIGLPAEALMHKKAVFLTNLIPCDVEGVTSEIKVVCLGDNVLECPCHALGTVLRFQDTEKEGKRAKTAAPCNVIVNYDANPGWRAFFHDVYYSPDGGGALCWRRNWRLFLAP